MTEEIIVGGINVAGCEFAVKPINDNRIRCHCVKGLLQINKMYEQPMKGLCKDNPNCYYKQLKRLEQENNSLQAQLNNITVQSNNAITALEQENKELKEKIKSRENELTNMAEQANMRINNYRSALEEIREHSKELLNNADNFEIVTNCANEIVNKIEEVLSENK